MIRPFVFLVLLLAIGCQKPSPAPVAAPPAAGSALPSGPGTAFGPVVLDVSGPVPGVPGALLYASPGGLWTLELATKAKKQVASFPQTSIPVTPAVSPDGKLIAFGLYQPSPDGRTPGGTDLHVMDRDGGGRRALLAHDQPLTSISEPAWAADGRSLYFTYVSATGQRRLERVNLDGSGRTTVLEQASTPTLSHDGQRLAFVKIEPGTFAQTIWIAGADGSGGRQVVPGKDFDALAVPRFGGDRLAFAAVGGPGVSAPPQSRRLGPALASRRPAWVSLPVTLSLTLSLTLSHQGRGNSPPVLSHQGRGDGSPSLYGRESEGGQAHGVPWDLWTVKADGSELRRLTDLGEDTPMPVWSPDSRWIAFSGELGLYLMQADGRNLVRLSDDWVAGGVTWLP